MTALSFREATETPFPSDATVISIGAPDTASPPGVRSSEDSHLRLEFDDITTDPPSKSQRDWYSPPEENHVQEIIDHAQSQSGPLVTHCQAGVSRSTAADVIGKCARGADPEEAYERMLEESPDPKRTRPNKRMLRIADEILDHERNYLQKIRDEHT